MGTENDDVKNGIANGTTSTFEQIVFKGEAKPTAILMHGRWVYGIDIQDIDHLVLRWKDSTFKGTFKVHPKNRMFRVNFPIYEPGFDNLRVNTRIMMTFLPVILNHATTGHKLQGKTVKELIIAQWSLAKNWAYVVLSRVKTLEGLYLLKEIPKDVDFSPHLAYLSMMERLCNAITVHPGDVNSLVKDFNICNYKQQAIK